MQRTGKFGEELLRTSNRYNIAQMSPIKVQYKYLILPVTVYH